LKGNGLSPYAVKKQPVKTTPTLVISINSTGVNDTIFADQSTESENEDAHQSDFIDVSPRAKTITSGSG